MSVACQIIRDSKGSIVSVEAPNGESSRLFNGLRLATNNEQTALDLWAFSYTDEYKDLSSNISLDQNGETSVEGVLNAVLSLRSEGTSLRPETKVGLVMSLIGSSFNSVSQVNNALQSLLVGGRVVISEQTLSETGLFTNTEISRIIGNNRLKLGLENLVFEAQNSAIDTSGTDEILSTSSPDFLTVKDGGVTAFGKETYHNPYELNKQLANSLAGITDRDSFTEAVMELPNEEIKVAYQNDVEFAEKLFNHFSQIQVSEVLEVNEDGSISAKQINNVSEQVINGAKPASMTSLESKFNSLQRVSPDVWNMNEKEVKGVLSDIVSEAAEFGLDVVGLEDVYDNATQAEVMSFLDILTDLTAAINADTVTSELLDSYSEAYNSIFGVEPMAGTVILPSSENTLVVVEGVENNEVLFAEHGLLHVRGNMYHRVEQSENFIEELYEVVVSDPTVLPQEAYYPSAYNTRTGEYNESKVSDPANRENIIRDVTGYLDKVSGKIYDSPINKETVREMTGLKLVYGHPLEVTLTVSENEAIQDMETFKGDPAYLSGEFVADFNILKVKEKAKNSFLYNNVLRHFSVGWKGISLNTTDPLSKAIIREVTPESGLYGNLRNYAKMSRSEDMNGLFAEEITAEPVVPYLRTFYRNNPHTLNAYKGKYSVQDGKYLVPNVQDNFLRIGEVLLEKSGTEGATALYEEVPTNTDPYFNAMFVNNGRVTPETVKDVFGGEEVGVQANNLYNSKEKGLIEEEIDRC